MSLRSLKKFRRILEKISVNAKKEKSAIYSLSPEANNFVFKDPFAFLLGVIADFGVKADIAWRLPYLLKQRLGNLDSKYLRGLSLNKVKFAMRYPKPLHRFHRNTARWIWKAARRVDEKCGGDATLIWDSDSALEIKARLIRFHGISHKKAYMMIKMLIRDWGLKVYDKDKVDLPYDVHNRRVLQRVGFAKSDSLQEISRVGRILNPNYPAGFDDALWLIGRNFCHASEPNCRSCPIRSICGKKNIAQTRYLIHKP